MQSQLKLIEKRQQEGQAVLPFLHAYMLNLACDDPGTIIGPQLVLPMLQERLLARASAFHERQAVQNQQEVAFSVSCCKLVTKCAPDITSSDVGSLQTSCCKSVTNCALDIPK